MKYPFVNSGTKAAILILLSVGCVSEPESLETSQAASEFTVSTIQELEAALEIANENDEHDLITMMPGVYRMSDLGCENGQFRIRDTDQQLRIVGGAGVELIADCEGQRLFWIYNNAELHLHGLHISRTNAGPSSGGIIGMFTGVLLLNDTTIESGHAFSGGAIYCNGGELRIYDSIIKDSYARWEGGAIALEACNATIEGSELRDNQADSIFTEYRGGGHIRAGAESHVTIRDSRLSGGRALNHGGAITLQSSDLAVSNAEFLGNKSDELGGAILGYDANIHISDTLFRANFIEVAGNDTVAGTAIASLSSEELVCQGCQFEANYSSSGGNSRGVLYVQGGAQVLVADSLFQENSVAGGSNSGGAMNLLNVSLAEVLNTVFSGNEAPRATGISAQGTVLHVDGCSFDNNRAEVWAGAVALTFGTFGFIENSSFSKNLANHGGAISVSHATAEIYRTTFTDNKSTFIGGAIHGSSASIRIADCDLQRNYADSSGGAFYMGGSSLYMSECVIEDNEALAFGGAIRAQGNQPDVETVNFAQLDIDKTTFADNSAGTGGAVSLRLTVMELKDSTLARNSAGEGTGIAIDDKSAVRLFAVTAAESLGTQALLDVSSDSSLRTRGSYLASSGESSVCDLSSSSSIDSLSINNYVTDGSCALPAQSLALANIVGPPALLTPLGYAGGPTPVFVPMLDGEGQNVLVDQYAGALCGATDQRLEMRPLGGACDYGSVEYSDEPVDNKGTEFPTWPPPGFPGPIDTATFGAGGDQYQDLL